MGNADLRELAVIETVAFEELAGSVVAIDAHNWLYRYLTTTVKFTNESVYTTDAGEEVANLVGVVQGLPKFFEHDITPVFVFDGGPSELKAEEIAKRREQRERDEEKLEKAREEGDSVRVSRLESRTQRLTETIHATTRELLSLLDVPIVEAPAEGEAQCAHMARTGQVDYAGSEDYDTMLFGAPRTVRQLTSKGDPELMDLERTLAKHDISWEQLVDVAILMGTDFNEGVPGFGPVTAVAAVKEHGDLLAVLDAESEHIDYAERIRELFVDPPTVEADFDPDIDPDVDAARAYVTEEWGVPAAEVERGFERIEESVVQTGLDEWA
jgi:flap endonuclease-1